MKRTRSLLWILGVALLAACGNITAPPTEKLPSTEKPAPGTQVQSDKQRVLSPTVDPNEFSQQVLGNREFAFKLYQQVRDSKENLFFSPHSISVALAMTQAGARNNTEKQIADTLGFQFTQDKLHSLFNALDLELNSRGQGAKAADGKAFRLNVVNAIWGQTGYDFLPDFLDVLALNYGSGLQALDFKKDPESSRQVINEWVEAKTEERIKDLLPEGIITSDTRLVLTNAIYFNAAWKTPFETGNTVDKPFHLLDGSTVSVPMMSGTQEAHYVKGSGYEAVELPYDGDELSMVMIVPDAGTWSTFEGTLDHSVFDTVVSQLSPTEIQLGMPKFEMATDMDVKKEFKEMGLIDPFEMSTADFSGINGRLDLFISAILHKAFVKVNEAGTEAAAATAVVINRDSAPAISLVIDRPFLFAIRDLKTNAILFLGRVLDPSV